MRRLSIVLAAVIVAAGIPVTAVAQNPDIGGDPVYTEEDYFSAGDWGMTAYSYVFDGTSTSMPEIFPVSLLTPGRFCLRTCWIRTP